MKTLITAICLILLPLIAEATYEVYDFKTQRYLTPTEFALQSEPQAFYILGEYHYNEPIQKAQASVMELLVNTHEAKAKFDLAWEFMNFNDHASIQTKWNAVQTRNLDIKTFLSDFGQSKADSYLPIFNAAINLKGNYYGVNAPRNIKKQIMDGGLSSVDPMWIPPRVEVGGDNYLERFREAMGGHVGDDVLKSYFLAQCYTDSVMAHYLNEFSKNDLTFLVVGAFHNDYRDGTVVRLEGLVNRDVISLKFVDGNLLSEDELTELLTPHSVYGSIADYLVIKK
ncbi:MAG: ChaN family lipoprotein [Bacteriovoracaceae bacterium]|nr:ChaN family lipoprotein [Bacteriovoracaceae bacterium]